MLSESVTAIGSAMPGSKDSALESNSVRNKFVTGCEASWKSDARSLAADEKLPIAKSLLNSRFADSSVSAEM